MSEEAWRRRLAELVDQLRSPPGEPELRDRLEFALARLWWAMQDPPPVVADAYERLDEEAISSISNPRTAALSLRSYADWSPDLTVELEALVLEVAAEVRAVDRALSENRGTPRASGNPNKDYLAYGDETVFIIPRPESFIHKGSRGQLFDRRGVIHNRVLPVLVEGYAVRLHEPTVRGPGMFGEEADLGSALFPVLRPKITQTDDTFWIEGLENEAALVTGLAGQMESLTAGGSAMAIVWPELAISPALLPILAGSLDAMGWLDSAPDVGFAVAGSWHEDRPGGRVNVSRVLDGSGMELFEVLKRTRFQTGGKMEGIVLGTELPVLIYGDVLIAFGICKDFCERRKLPSPFRLLDVDFVIAPSLSRPDTIEEHAKVAGDLQYGFGTRAFVVQQTFPPENDTELWGHYLEPGAKPRDACTPRAQNILLVRATVSCTSA